MKPLVSICIPTCNGEAYLDQALNSAIAQTYRNIEIVISDDASQDGTLKIVESYKQKTNIPIYVYNHEPQGIGANWNNCVKQAKGDYIKFLFQDDILEPACIDKMMQLALTNPKIGLVYCKRHFMVEGPKHRYADFINNYKTLHDKWANFMVTEGVISGRVYLRDPNFLKSPGNKIGEPSAVLLNKTCLENVGYFSTSLKQNLDYLYWYLVMPHFLIGFVDDYLVRFRLHDNQATSINKSQNINEKQMLYYEYYKHILLYLSLKNEIKLIKQFNPFIKLLIKIKQKLNGR
ncbi:glycosyltransferase family 2 protein [Aestuariivivens sediminicola]|uniref:glycosyltransferase family 2 protein n=1 Tax=Aestuariivivens sediminicola TaxID=2913560 RepID=UPI001F572D07|nr:glycosyltransferase family 2 protein [Aestuariivivens sediminicola]